MKATQFALLLHRAVALAQQDRCAAATGGLSNVANALDQIPTKSIKDVVEKVRERAKTSGCTVGFEPGVIGQLRLLRAVLDAAGAAKFAQDCDLILALSVESHLSSVVSFEDLAKEATRPVAKKAKNQASPASETSSCGPFVIRDYADRLSAAVLDRIAFDHVVGELSNPHSFSLFDLKLVADQFLGSPRPYRTRKDVLKAINLRRFQEETQVLREKALAKVAI